MNTMNMQNDQTSNSESEGQEFQSLELSFVGSLLPGILHNIATPLSGVIGATQLMEMRNVDQDKILERLDSANQQATEELTALLRKNKTNLDIIERNATQLIDLVHVLVQRFQRSSVRRKLPQSLNELLKNELVFLHANLVFKHKVRREVQLSDEPFAVSFSYPHIIGIVDEFVTKVIDAHDTKQGMANMSFATRFEEDMGLLEMKADYMPFANDLRGIDTFGIYLARIREDGCDYRFDSELGKAELSLTIPR
jgi:signal transduction histidine kinase